MYSMYVSSQNAHSYCKNYMQNSLHGIFVGIRSYSWRAENQTHS